MFLSHKQYAYQ
jgi:hypothetical protein